MRRNLRLFLQLNAGVDLARVAEQRADQLDERLRVVAGHIMVSRRAAETWTRGQSNQRNAISNGASELQNAFAVHSLALYGNDACRIWKRLEYFEGFACTVCCKNVELCRFQYEFASGQRLAGFWFRDNQRRTHTWLDAMREKMEAQSRSKC